MSDRHPSVHCFISAVFGSGCAHSRALSLVSSILFGRGTLCCGRLFVRCIVAVILCLYVARWRGESESMTRWKNFADFWFIQMSIGGMKASVFNCRVNIDLKAPITLLIWVVSTFWSFVMISALDLSPRDKGCHIGLPCVIAARITAV